MDKLNTNAKNFSIDYILNSSSRFHQQNTSTAIAEEQLSNQPMTLMRDELAASLQNNLRNSFSIMRRRRGNLHQQTDHPHKQLIHPPPPHAPHNQLLGRQMSGGPLGAQSNPPQPISEMAQMAQMAAVAGAVQAQQQQQQQANHNLNPSLLPLFMAYYLQHQSAMVSQLSAMPPSGRMHPGARTPSTTATSPSNPTSNLQVPSPIAPTSNVNARTSTSNTSNITGNSITHSHHNHHHHHSALATADKLDNLKPAHSYIGLIAMCILSSPEKRMVLNDIYQFILNNYPYYRNRGSGWRNSVRHNLSLNECFQKAGRAANGKGHYWTIHPANMEDFMLGDFRRRRAQRKVRRWNNMDVPSDESDDESMEDATKPPLPEHFKRSLEMHRQLELIHKGRAESIVHDLASLSSRVLSGNGNNKPDTAAAMATNDLASLRNC